MTAGQTPSWLRSDHPRISVVDHGEIFDAASLPTFNSHAIESRLHHIEGLSEHFLYLNDDFILGRPVSPQLFFSASGQSAAFLSPTKVGDDQQAPPPHVAAALNNRALLERDFGRTITRGLLHAPYPLRRSVLCALEERYAADFERTANSAFRSVQDVSVPSSLYPHYALARGYGFAGSIRSAYVGLGQPDVGQRLERALQTRGYDAITIGDFHEYALEPAQIDEMVRSFFDSYFPFATNLERG